MNEQDGKGFSKLFGQKKFLIILAALVVILGGAGMMTLQASEKPEFCASCHNMKSYYASYNDSDLLAHKHAEAGVSCHDCHQKGIPDKVSEGVKYITGNYKTPMDKRDFGTSENCLKCHNYDKVKSKTDFKEGNPHASHYGQMDCNTCHNMHQGSRAEKCAECHNFSWIDKQAESGKKN